jgi:hypothetical protein
MNRYPHWLDLHHRRTAPMIHFHVFDGDDLPDHLGAKLS